MKSNKNKINIFCCTFVIAIACAICAVVFPYNNKIYASDITRPDITKASVQDDYFCLKDYYRIDTPCQASMGTCWIFSFTKTLETNLAITTGEYYDFSEAWLTLCVKVENSSYEIGAGGHQTNCFNVAKKYGLLLETEFPYEYALGFDDNNYLQIYNMYKGLAHSYIPSDISYTNFANTKWVEKSDKILNTKAYLLKNGAISTNINDSEFQSINGRSCTYSEKVLNHSVTIIGWDDNLSFNDSNGILRQGVFIALNSWGDNELICISYDDPNLLKYLYGFENASSQNKDDTISISNSNSNFINYQSPICNSIDYSRNKTVFLDTNIYKYGENIQIEYQYSNLEQNANAKIDAKILLNNCNANNQFSQLKQNGNKFYVGTNTIVDSGTYVITFSVDKDGDSTIDYTFKKQIIVFSGTELSYALTAEATKYQSYQMMNTILSTKNKNTIYVYSVESNPKITISFSEYSRIKYMFCSDDNLIPYTDYYQYESIQPYSSTVHKFRLSSSDSENEIQTYNLFIQTYDDNIVQIEIKWYKLSNNDKKVVAYYSPTENYDTSSNAKSFVYGEDYSVNFTKRSHDKKNNYYYYKTDQYNDEITSEDFIESNYSNYSDKKHLSKFPNFKYEYAIVYVNVTDNLLFTFEDVDLGDNFHYGTEINCPIPQPINTPIRGVVCAIENENWPKGVSCNPYTFSLTGVPMSTGNFSFDVVCKFNDNVTSNKTIHVKFSVQKRRIKYKLDSKISEYGESLLPFTYQITSGKVVSGDDLQMQFNCDANPLSIGKFNINSTTNNPNYVAICEYGFEPATYTITKRNIKYNLVDYNGVYDGKEHTISLEILNCTTAKIEYSLDNQTFSENAIYFKNATDTTKIYIRISDENSNTLELESSISITPKVLSLSEVTTEVYYNGQFQCPQFTINGMLPNEDAKIIVSQSQIEVGIYPFTIVSNNPNYSLNEQLTFSIKKAIPNYQMELTIEVDGKIKNLSEIKLPNGYSFNDPTQKFEPNKTYWATYTPDDTQHYETIENVKITIKQKHSNFALILILSLPCIVIVATICEFAIKAKKKKVQKTNKK